jgi:hypothetical protein
MRLTPSAPADEVHRIARRSQQSNDGKHPSAHAREPVGPRGEQQPREDENRARQRRQQDARQANRNQNSRDHPQDNRHVRVG